jgi:hypothetical protein
VREPGQGGRWVFATESQGYALWAIVRILFTVMRGVSRGRGALARVSLLFGSRSQG